MFAKNPSLRHDAVAHLFDRDAPRRLFLLSPPLLPRLLPSVVRRGGRPRSRLGLLPLPELVLGHGVGLAIVLRRVGIRTLVSCGINSKSQNIAKMAFSYMEPQNFQLQDFPLTATPVRVTIWCHNQ